MPIRPATYADLLPASKCLAAAFKDEHLFGITMHPHQAQFPNDMYLCFLHKLRLAYFSGPDHHILVSYRTAASSSGKDQEIITGLAHWTRFRPEPTTTTLSLSFSTTALTKSLVEWYNYFESLLSPNRAACPAHTSLPHRLAPFCHSFWTSSRASVYDLTLLGVDPVAGRKGYGRELVEWGFERAKEEGVGCSVVSSEGNEGFYQRCGFDTVVGTARDFGGMENPLNALGVRGGTVLFWDNGREVG